MKNSGFQKMLIVSNMIMLSFLTYVLVNGFSKDNKAARFTEIDAERINIIGENGRPVLVLTNKQRIPGPSASGRSYSPDIIDGRKYFAGLLFFSETGDEVGGLIYSGIKKDSIAYSQVVHLSFDQWKQNQVIALDYNDNGKNRYSGLRVWDRPVNIPLSIQLNQLEAMVANKNNSRKVDSIRKLLIDAQDRGENGIERMFIGSKDEVAQIQLKDKKGIVKARLYVDNTTNAARLEFYNENGEVINSFPK
ncbi:hypothetical protein BEL04_09815 [Mucilaginibacter sp. PPCGB 2223]|uniref:hypothetical protein n=1 Tax=Mucilaginibacter sp. PPCGB 2223 TaxID=1886027 RepID=UPI00082475F0|nr:hypothetical protein [Mucilaginibacter sp. PPCGB 2223]OCX54522.1 hypothetical protein BEL04_09815 [Mucilaginibacter sp. PPCGB 2223]